MTRSSACGMPGGTIVNGPMKVPGERWVAQCLDPQGAMFALLSGKR